MVNGTPNKKEECNEDKTDIHRIHGSVTLYIGPKAPKGYENNWIPTGGKVPFLLFRFYGPEQALFNRTFMLDDVELVK